MAKACLPGMLAQQAGVIIHIASVQGLQSQVGIPAYASSKGGILSLTRQMGMDYSNAGVRTVSVSPGTIRTPLVQRLVEEDGVQTCEELGCVLHIDIHSNAMLLSVCFSRVHVDRRTHAALFLICCAMSIS